MGDIHGMLDMRLGRHLTIAACVAALLGGCDDDSESDRPNTGNLDPSDGGGAGGGSGEDAGDGVTCTYKLRGTGPNFCQEPAPSVEKNVVFRFWDGTGDVIETWSVGIGHLYATTPPLAFYQATDATQTLYTSSVDCGEGNGDSCDWARREGNKLTVWLQTARQGSALDCAVPVIEIECSGTTVIHF